MMASRRDVDMGAVMFRFGTNSMPGNAWTNRGERQWNHSGRRSLAARLEGPVMWRWAESLSVAVVAVLRPIRGYFQ